MNYDELFKKKAREYALEMTGNQAHPGWVDRFAELLYENRTPESPILQNTYRSLRQDFQIYPNGKARLDTLGRELKKFRDRINDEIADIMFRHAKDEQITPQYREHLGMIPDYAPSIIYKPGSVWLKREGTWSRVPDREGLLQDIKQQPRTNSKVILTKSKQIPEWKIICSQLGDYRKDELVNIINNADLSSQINPRWTKTKICEELAKQMAVLIPKRI